MPWPAGALAAQTGLATSGCAVAATRQRRAAARPAAAGVRGRAVTGRAAPDWPAGYLVSSGQPCFVSQKIFPMSSILASSLSAVATSVLPFVPPAPASLVASLNSSCSCGYFAKCGGLK